MSRDLNDVSIGFGNTACNCSYTDLGNKLNRNLGSGIYFMKIVNKLSKIFDRVDVVMRWR